MQHPQSPAEDVHHVQPCLPALTADLQTTEQTLSKALAAAAAAAVGQERLHPKHFHKAQGDGSLATHQASKVL
jgi:hypothetical protein